MLLNVQNCAQSSWYNKECYYSSTIVFSAWAAQKQVVLDLLHAERFADQAPAEIHASLLDEGVYHCSIRTMYRMLDQNGAVRERRKQLRHPTYQNPELLAERPNQVWFWGITKLMRPARWNYFYRYVILDIFSRRVVSWCVADAETATLARPLFDDAVAKHRVPPGQLTLHGDRGGPVKAKAHLGSFEIIEPSRTFLRPGIATGIDSARRPVLQGLPPLRSVT